MTHRRDPASLVSPAEEDPIMLHVAAVLTARPGQRAVILAEVEEILPRVRAEPGCIHYGPGIDIDGGPAFLHRLGPDRLAIVERWESRAALEAHAEAAHMMEFRARIAPALLSRDVWVLQDA
jgi:quinol monooxygenase YgiN